jgi:hypothetical protein
VKFTFPKTNKAPSRGLGRGLGLKGGLDWGCPQDFKKRGMAMPISNGYITEKALFVHGGGLIK